jgi:hypothetical protein
MREPPPGRHFIPDGLGYIVSCPATCLRSAAPGTRVRDANYGDPSPQSAQRSRRKLELLTNAPRPHDGCSVRVPGLIVGRETAPVIGSCTILPVPDAHTQYWPRESHTPAMLQTSLLALHGMTLSCNTFALRMLEEWGR